MNYKDRIKMFEDGVQNEYHNVNRNGEYRNYVGQGKQELDPFDSTYTITIALITSSVSGKARIFGTLKDATEATNTTNNVTVTIAESSHVQVKAELYAASKRLKGINLEAYNATTLSKALQIFRESTAGALTRKYFQPTKYKLPTNLNSLQIVTDDFQMILDANTYIDVEIPSGIPTTSNALTIVVGVCDQVDPNAALNDQAAVKSAMPYTVTQGFKGGSY